MNPINLFDKKSYRTCDNPQKKREQFERGRERILKKYGSNNN